MKGLEHVDALKAAIGYLPLTTAVMVRAAELWAKMRNLGTPTAPPDALDADVILAAIAESVGAIIVTENVGHLSRMVPAKHWREFVPKS